MSKEKGKLTATISGKKVSEKEIFAYIKENFSDESIKVFLGFALMSSEALEIESFTEQVIKNKTPIVIETQNEEISIYIKIEKIKPKKQ